MPSNQPTPVDVVTETFAGRRGRRYRVPRKNGSGNLNSLTSRLPFPTLATLFFGRGNLQLDVGLFQHSASNRSGLIGEHLPDFFTLFGTFGDRSGLFGTNLTLVGLHIVGAWTIARSTSPAAGDPTRIVLYVVGDRVLQAVHLQRDAA